MKKVLVVSALSLGTGSGLRARYLNDAFTRLGMESRLLVPLGKPQAFSAEFLMSIPRFLFGAWQRRDLMVGVKPYPNVWLALALGRLRGALTVLDVDDADGSYRGGLLGSLTKVLQWPAFFIAHFTSTHHPLLKKQLQGRVGSFRVLDLPQGVDTTVFDPQRYRANAKAWRKTQGFLDGPLLGYAAHLNIACQLEVVLNAVSPWLKRRPGAVLLILGGGPDLAHFKMLAAPLGAQVRFLGSMSPEEIAAALTACDVGLSAYDDGAGNQYRVPMKVAEYLALGLPVVSNMIAGLHTLKPYIQVAETHPAAYAGALNRALSSAGKLKARRGQSYVWRMLAWDRVAKDFRAAIQAKATLLGKNL